MVQARQSIGSGSIEKNAVTANALVEDRETAHRRSALQTCNKDISPAVIPICCSAMSIGNRVAQNHNRS